MAVSLSTKVKPVDISVTEGLEPGERLKTIATLAHPLVKRQAKLKEELDKIGLELAKLQNDVLVAVDEMELEKESTLTVHGTKGSVKIGKEAIARKLTDKEAAIDMLEEVEEGLAFELAEFKLGDLDKYLTPEQLEKVLTTNWSGKRSIKFA